MDSPGQVRTTFEGAVATVTLSQPARLNAITVAMWRELSRTFAALAENDGCRVVIVTGAGQQFSAGADITEFPHVRRTADEVYSYHEDVVAPALQAILHCVHPTVAVIEGACLGGGLEIACCCDLRLAASTAKLGAPISRLGFPMAPLELETLLAVVGRAVTLELLLEGRALDANEAFSKGLLTRVVPATEIGSAARDCAARILLGAPGAARRNKEIIRRLAGRTDGMSAEERRAFFDGWSSSPDHLEGVQAFLEGRSPVFRERAQPESRSR